jgi:hypothetical protein
LTVNGRNFAFLFVDGIMISNNGWSIFGNAMLYSYCIVIIKKISK